MKALKKVFGKKAPEPASDVQSVSLDGKTLFVGLGVMKTGTTWLSQYLKTHPEAYHSSLKEMNFFNTLVPNTCRNMGPRRRLDILNDVILKFPTPRPIPPKARAKIYDIAEIGRFDQDTEKYMSYFAQRTGECSVFGEISTSYSTLPAEGFRKIAESHPDTRMFLIMRDPTARAVSHLQHKMRRQIDMDVDANIEEIEPGNIVYERSDYPKALNAIAEGAGNTPFLAMVYENLFSEKAVREFCDFLGISYQQPDFGRRVNVARTIEFTPVQKDRIREKLDPIYIQMDQYFGQDKPAKWLWS